MSFAYLLLISQECQTARTVGFISFSEKEMSRVFPKTTTSLGREEVYVAAMPLRATKGPAQLLMSAAFSLNLWDFQHFMVIVKPNSTLPDFQVYFRT